MVNADILQVFSVVLAAAALAVAIYSRRKQRKVEKRLNRKEDLKSLADDLDDLRLYSEDLESNLRNPFNHDDLAMHLSSAARELLAVNHDSSQTPEVEYNLSIESDTEQIKPADPDELLDNLKQNTRIHLSIAVGSTIDEYDGYFGGSIDQALWPADGFYDSLSDAKESHPELLDEFDTGIISDIEEKVDSIIIALAIEIIEIDEPVDFPVHEYEGTREISQAVFETAFYYNGIEEDLNELSNLNNQLADLRADVLQVSYS